ncbi:X-box-binding protein 1 isoform X2 [Narcine bancroftii]|uniref:X-box-binding protein 1 isoform X2 n=1 Tax=Narcine bancroftii TaxID=1343680 RepID=UPI0038315ED2
MVAVTPAASAKVLLIPGGKQKGLEVSQPVSVVYPARGGSLHDSPPRPAAAANHGHRKRQRLTHLSPEEKALRRKLKNRVAAQTARDRKKARMSELEEQVSEMEFENQKLQIENRLLHEKTHSLLSENQELRQRLGMETLDTEKEKVLRALVPSLSVSHLSTTCASAAGAGPTVCQVDSFHVDTDSIDSSDSESDLFLGILDYFDPETLFRFNEEGSRPFELGECTYNENVGCLPASTPAPLGASSTKLEAINEMIHFDHFYHKPLAESNVVQSSETAIKIEQVSFGSTNEMIAEASLPMELKQEPSEDEFLTEMQLTNQLSSRQWKEKPMYPFAHHDSDYEGSSSPLSDMSSPLTFGNNWEDVFTSELFPQLIAV